MFDNIKPFKGNWKILKAMPKVASLNIFQTYKTRDLSRSLWKTRLQNLKMQFWSTIASITEQFSYDLLRSGHLKKCADIVTLETLNLGRLYWIDLNNSETQIINVQSRSNWRRKFRNVRAELGSSERDQLVC
jgi:hypothetical protein